MELKSATAQHFTATDYKEIFLRTHDGFNWPCVQHHRVLEHWCNVLERNFWPSGRIRVCWRRLHAESPHSSAKKTLGTRGTKMLMNFKQDSAGDDEALRAKPANGPVLSCESQPDEPELTHLPFRSCCQHCVGAKGKKAHTMSRVLASINIRHRPHVHG